METIIVVSALSALAIVGFGLALWCEYQDGIIGHAALFIVGGSALLLLIDMLDGAKYQFSPLTIAIFAGCAIFGIRHAANAVKFHRKARKEERKCR